MDLGDSLITLVMVPVIGPGIAGFFAGAYAANAAGKSGEEYGWGGVGAVVCEGAWLCWLGNKAYRHFKKNGRHRSRRRR